MSAFSEESVNVQAFAQSYVFPHAITALSPTLTKFGMTSKDLIGMSLGFIWIRRIVICVS